MTNLPGDLLEEDEYFFEIGGEVTVRAYSEEDAKEQMKENLRELVSDAVRDGSVEIR